jgi:NAD(P)-dependent dehydrogenase (short-subunit alcohol dehydrogenase family)
MGRELGEFSLRGKVAAVTACCRGMGRAVALRFAWAGADLAVCCRHGEHLEDLAREARAMGARCLCIEANMGTRQGIEHFFERVLEEYGRVDILMNNLGVNPVMAPLVDLPEEVWQKILDSNLTSHFLCCRRAALSMIKNGKGGVIINMSSVAAFRPSAGTGAYAVSKAALNMLTKALALELGPHGIRVNAICPGLIRTRFSSALWRNPQILEAVTRGTALGRIGEPEEVAAMALYLASDASSFVTGEAFVVSGGRI